MDTHDLIVVGGSAGGLEALIQLVAMLPADLPAALCVVVHVLPYVPSAIPEILTRSGPLPAEHARENQSIEKGHIYVAPPNYHLLVEYGRMRLIQGPRVKRVCPAIDPLFHSAALAYGPRVTGVILSGMRDDGVAGLVAIADRGGVTIVQQPEEALHPSLPLAAIASNHVKYILPVTDIAEMLTRLAHEEIPENTDRGSE